MKQLFSFLTIVILLAIALVSLPATVDAHQPYCEFSDLTSDSVWEVPDSTVSYAYYGNLYPQTDIDYFIFEATEGQSVLLSLSIPAIEGQEDFAPVMVVFGPELDMDTLAALPEEIVAPEGQGAMMVPLGEEPEYWFEPFGQRYYWNWDNYFFDAPQDATYTVAVWHPEQELGRYSFVIGEEEIRGGDQECMASFDDYWTPLVDGENPYREMMVMDDNHMHADGSTHDHSTLIELSPDSAPIVDLQVIPLSDGTYNVRVQTLNFEFAPQNIGMEPVAGEGHAHLYIDGVKIARIYGEWYHLETLPEGAQMISVGLYANNHQPLAVDGVEITDMVMVEELIASSE